MQTASSKRSPTDRPQGEAAGPCAPAGRLAGRVHSVFARCCNIELSGHTLLLPLLDAGLAAQPHAWTLHLPEGSDCRDWFSPGTPVLLNERGLTVGTLYLPRPDTRLPEHAFRVPAHRCAIGRIAAHLPALSLAIERAAAVRPATEWHAAHPLLRGPRDAYRTALARPDSLPEATAALVGLGCGLTPAGDDLLCGSLAVLAWRAPALFARAASAIRPQLATTSRVSGDYLLLACQAMFSPLLAALLQALADGDGPQARHALTALLAHGSSSGLDTAIGVVDTLHALGVPAWLAA
ncbi:DUF2877 domain-containing protein [Crenobacter caeni]|uniref:DUF2877 domain-containing protein n=1 Tax=Crenobacter caeni TaxID=2705474 RepID=A0A6B2KU79_9NEIS|nr:DUF2877 domain-containing protein [Crenobacter caeni]NDV13559.1 DUF2877 domain-containing protein [Crenobacter caeni]